MSICTAITCCGLNKHDPICQCTRSSASTLWSGWQAGLLLSIFPSSPALCKTQTLACHTAFCRCWQQSAGSQPLQRGWLQLLRVIPLLIPAHHHLLMLLLNAAVCAVLCVSRVVSSCGCAQAAALYATAVRRARRITGRREDTDGCASTSRLRRRLSISHDWLLNVLRI